METLALTTGKRKIKDGSRFNHLFPSETLAYGHDRTLKINGTVQDTVKYIARMIEAEKADTAEIAKTLKAPTREQTIANIHKFMIDYLQYDTEAGEKLRTPRRTWWVGQKQKDRETGDTGVDCDDLVIFSGSILRNLNIPFFIRIVKIDKDDFQHVYIVVPNSGNELSGTYLTLDGVISDFDFEYPYKTQETYNLKGMKIEYLGALQTATDPIKSVLINLYRELSTNRMVTQNINQQDAKTMLNYAIKHWDNPAERQQALQLLAQKEAENYPGQRFFHVLALYPSPAFFAATENFARSGVLSLSGFSGDGDYYDDTSWADDALNQPDNLTWYNPDTNQLQNNTPEGWTDPYRNANPNPSFGSDGGGGDGSGQGWAIAAASIAALAQVDWAGIFGKNQNNLPPYQLDQYGKPITTQPQGINAQIAGYSLTTILLVGGLVAGGVYLAKNISTKKQKTA